MRTSTYYAMMGAVFLGMLFLFPSPDCAGADGYVENLPAWTQVGSACVVDESSLKVFSVTGPSLSFKAGAYNTTLIARCNVLNPLDAGNPDWNGLIVDYRDPDGKGTAYHVKALLKALKRADGSVSLLAAFDSNAFSTTTRVEHSKTFSHPFNFLNYEYYVEIQIYRSNTNGNPYLKAVRLTNLF